MIAAIITTPAVNSIRNCIPTWSPPTSPMTTRRDYAIGTSFLKKGRMPNNKEIAVLMRESRLSIDVVYVDHKMKVRKICVDLPSRTVLAVSPVCLLSVANLTSLPSIPNNPL